jgi:hypothetical protein
MYKMPLFDVNKKLKEIKKRDGSQQPDGPEELHKGK